MPTRQGRCRSGVLPPAQGQQARSAYLWIAAPTAAVARPTRSPISIRRAVRASHVANLPSAAGRQPLLGAAVRGRRTQGAPRAGGGRHGCGGVAAAVDGRWRGLVDHWLHPIREVAHDHRDELDACEAELRAIEPAAELNVKRQVRNVADVACPGRLGPRQEPPYTDAGLGYSLGTGLVNDLDTTISGPGGAGAAGPAPLAFPRAGTQASFLRAVVAGSRRSTTVEQHGHQPATVTSRTAAALIRDLRRVRICIEVPDEFASAWMTPASARVRTVLFVLFVDSFFTRPATRHRITQRVSPTRKAKACGQAAGLRGGAKRK